MQSQKVPFDKMIAWRFTGGPILARPAFICFNTKTLIRVMQLIVIFLFIQIHGWISS